MVCSAWGFASPDVPSAERGLGFAGSEAPVAEAGRDSPDQTDQWRKPAFTEASTFGSDCHSDSTQYIAISNATHTNGSIKFLLPDDIFRTGINPSSTRADARKRSRRSV